MALTDIPVQIGMSLGAATYADALLLGGLILSSAVMVSIVMVMSYASRGRGTNIFGQIIVMFSVMGILTFMQWLPSWVMVIGVVALAALFGGKLIGWVGR